MLAQNDRRQIRRRVRHRIRARIRGTAARPRLAVFRSSKHISVQAIDDDAGRTLAQASTQEVVLRGEAPKGWNLAAAVCVGRTIATRLQAVGVKQAVFDRGGWVYHGRIKALADAVREAGLEL